MSRILIFTGKGGVGKTSVAAAHARHSAVEGVKTLIVSTDMAHNLGDIFQTSIGKETKEITENLFALEVDPNYIMENEFSDMKQAMIKMIGTTDLPFGDLTQLAMFPGEDELFSLLKILDIYESGEYERIIVDCAPTGETLSLLKFPELLSWYMEKFFPVGKIATRIFAPISKRVYKVELPDKAAMNDIEKLFVKMVELQELLKNREITSIRLVAIPEKMVVEETKRNYMYMNLYNFHVDGLYINRILPKDIDNAFFNEWIDIQNQYIEEYEMVFAMVPIYKIPWFDTDINGLDGVDRIREKVLVDRGVFDVVDFDEGEKYIKTDKGYDLYISIPCVEKEELTMHESKSDIIIKIGNFKRNIPKPSSLRSYEIAAAKFVDQKLIIGFEKC